MHPDLEVREQRELGVCGGRDGLGGGPTRSSPRIARPAWREARVAYVYQFAARPVRESIAADIRP